MAKSAPGIYPDSDWHIDPVALANNYVMSGIQLLSPEDGFRLNPTFGKAEGFREIINLEPGFQAVLSDLTCREESVLSMQSDSSLKFHFRIEGENEMEIDHSHESSVEHHTMGVLLHPDGLDKQEHYFAGQHELSVALICEPRFLSHRFASLAKSLPTALANYVNENKAEFYANRFPIRTDMVTAANAMLATLLEGTLRRHYLEAKALELLTLSFVTIIEHEKNTDNPERGLSQRDIDRMHKAREILEANYIDSPTIGALAREIGVNEAKLMHAFKQLFGQTIFDYTQNLRMDKAKELLETTERSITEIAFDVGYEYSSNFTTAFKRRFSITPSAARDGFRR
jgi:AraC-like DNA-binding protein